MRSWLDRSIVAGLTLLALYGSEARAAEVDLDPPYANRYRAWQTTARITNATIGVSALLTPILLIGCAKCGAMSPVATGAFVTPLAVTLTAPVLLGPTDLAATFAARKQARRAGRGVSAAAAIGLVLPVAAALVPVTVLHYTDRVNHLPMLGLTGSLLAFSIGTELQLRANARAVRPLASPTSPWPP